MSLLLHSEPFSPDGNLSAEGFENLLGTPSLDLLAILVREAVQNSCDATRSDAKKAEVRIRIRSLTSEQRLYLKERVFQHLPDEDTARQNLSEVLLGGDDLKVLEIADYGTTGLAGPTRADVPLADNENPDFVNFFRNIGAARDVEGGGGTYGYGKATLYRASSAHTILVDTRTTDAGTPTRRFMAAQMGRAVSGRTTGRHWWGVGANDGLTVEPLTGEAASECAKELGMPERPDNRAGLGTTVMILAPHLPADGDMVVGALTEYLLWNFWPRMMQTTPAGKKLSALVARDGETWQPVPNPEEFAPLDLLCHAMNATRGTEADETDVFTKKKSIRSFRPARVLGTLAISSGRAAMRKWLLPPRSDSDNEGEEQLQSIIPTRLRHVALMRPAQLVVRYEVGKELADHSQEWGGVFMCSEDIDIEGAFARSEPPAHDDWQPESLPAKSYERRFVNLALKRIRDAIAGEDETTETAPAEEVPLAIPATAMGRLLPGAQGDGGGRGSGGGGGGSGGSRRPFSQPRPVRLFADPDGQAVAEFEFDLHADGRSRNLEAVPRVVIDGSAQDPDEATGYPQVREWLAPDGSSLSGIGVVAHLEGRWVVRVTIPGDVAVGLRIREPRSVVD
ncbi:hypothetical protein GS636_06895 [Ruegeria sp. HKCCD4884]|uniref:hypothetical protein n=1 Tax=Ruegeria sp. HKCCD4884 TaxID=2683022 RepID=UPI001491A56B|nr:hypothetical protein [Ruegeria sp. HKCCD4884]NOD92508.1 hypothetical protein [Ruegeria sp. HKCCD4884]